MSAWWTLDGTIEYGINACGQLVELRHEHDQFLVLVHTPMIPDNAPVALATVGLANADNWFWIWMHATPDELDLTPLENWRAIQRMRLHPSWDHDAEDQP